MKTKIAAILTLLAFNLFAEEDPVATHYEWTFANNTTNPVQLYVSLSAEIIWAPPNSVISGVSADNHFLIAPGTDDITATLYPYEQTFVSYLGSGVAYTGRMLSPSEITRQQLINAAGSGLTAGLPVSGAILAFLLVRRAWTIGDRQSVD